MKKIEASFPFAQWNEQEGWCLYDESDGYDWPYRWFNPSTDISAAWEALVKLDREVTVKRYAAMGGYRYWCRISETDPTKFDEVIAHGQTAPEAIAKASLLAMEGRV